MSTTANLNWESAGLSNPGKVRSVNEDNFLARGADRLWLVADGMGGHTAGDLASQTIVDAFRDLALPTTLSGLVDAVESCLLSTNQHLQNISAARDDQPTIGSTVVVLLALGHYVTCLWVGDSRIYRLRDKELVQLTQDHSQVEELIMHGLLLREDAENHPAANVVTRAIGAMDEVFVDMDYVEARTGDRFLLCSDGLTKELSDAQIRAMLALDGTAKEICKSLIGAALDRGARDNVTVVVTKVLDPGPDDRQV